MESEKSAIKTLSEQNLSRREWLTGVAGAGVGIATAVLAGCGGGGLSGGSTNDAARDRTILGNAVAAEALATVMYYNILKSSIYTSLAGNAADQAYLVAAYQQELNHYNQLVAFGGTPIPSGTNVYFPAGMFTDKQITLNALETLEDAFIATYLIGVRDFGNASAKVLAAQIMGVEAEHRVLARVIANDLGLSQTTGLSGNPESVTPPSHTVNNLAYERTFGSKLPDIAAVGITLNNYFTSGAPGFSTTPYPFDATVMTLPPGITPVTLANTTP